MPCCKLVASVFAATAAAETRKKPGFLPFLTPNPSSEIILEVAEMISAIANFISAIADLILEVAGIILEITEIALAVAEIILEVSEMILEVAETSSVNAFFSFAVAEATSALADLDSASAVFGFANAGLRPARAEMLREGGPGFSPVLPLAGQKMWNDRFGETARIPGVGLTKAGNKSWHLKSASGM